MPRVRKLIEVHIMQNTKSKYATKKSHPNPISNVY